MNKFPVKYHQWAAVTPFKAFDCDELEESVDCGLLHLLHSGLHSVLETLEQDKKQYELRFALRVQELEEKLLEKEQAEQELLEANQGLKAENGQLKGSLEQMVRYAKRFELKQQLLNNKITHLSQQLGEREAVIRYLEGKTHPLPTPNPPKHMLASLTHEQPHDDSFRTIPDLAAYGIAKNVNDIKFEDFKVAVRSDKEAGREGREAREGKARRNRTECN